MNNEVLIAYYSWHGNTKKIAEMIQKKTGGTLFEIEPVSGYSPDYNTVLEQAKKEIRNGISPELRTVPENTSYKTVFLGSPNWWSTMAPPLASFIKDYDLNGKTVVPFLSHGGGGAGSYERDIKRMCPGSVVRDALIVTGGGDNGTEAAVEKWLQTIGL